MTAIGVWVLHKLQDQSQPGNVFLFYQDIEEEIENTTAAKLEGFIAIKTKPITNSVTKWVESTACKVKSRIEWIETWRTGKNSNIKPR